MPRLRDVVRSRDLRASLEADANERIDIAFARMRAQAADAIAVMRRGRFLGTVRAADLAALVRAEELSRSFD